MTLMRDTLLVGGATFLVGSVLMEVSVEQEGKEVGWWPYVGTFISGALGFYLLTATDIVKVKESEDGEGKQFMAEVFEADRKARRRTTLTWTRGLDPKWNNNGTFGDASGNQPYTPSGYWSQNQLTNDRAYHITGLPEGYHIHLWKPRRRGNHWNTYMKSPHIDDWKYLSNYKKSQAMRNVLDWYNDQIAVPEKMTLTPIQAMLQQQGLVSSDIQIKRVQPTPEKVQYFAEGGPQGLLPTKFLEMKGKGSHPTLWMSNVAPEEVKDFCRGMIYLPNRHHTGNLRSVNRYNADRSQWVKSKPAWFQNMCRLGINTLYVKLDYSENFEIHTNTTSEDFLQFYGQGPLRHETKTITLSDGAKMPAFQVGVPVKDEDDDWTIEWEEPRPSTQRKMYESYDNTGSRKAHIFLECVKKYQPQNYPGMFEAMTTDSLSQDTEGFARGNLTPSRKQIDEACHIMLRRVKKK